MNSKMLLAVVVLAVLFGMCMSMMARAKQGGSTGRVTVVPSTVMMPSTIIPTTTLTTMPPVRMPTMTARPMMQMATRAPVVSVASPSPDTILGYMDPDNDDFGMV